MKFNTALLFLFTSVGLILSFRDKPTFKTLNKFVALFILLISGITLTEYIFKYQSVIDNFFVTDRYSTTYPGRMSPSTAFCFFLISLCFWGIHKKKQKIISAIIQCLHLVNILSLISILSFLLLIPVKSRMFFFNSMALHTSVLFFVLSFTLLLKFNNKGVIGLLTGEHSGNKLFRRLLPFIIFLPIVQNYILLELLSNKLISYDFGVVISTALFLVLCIVYISTIAFGLNKSDEKKTSLEKSLTATNQELMQFKYALDQSSIIAFTDEKGIINYVNDKFCEISKFKREEILGKTHSIINSGYHSKDFFRDLWKTIKAGKVWIGEVKNKAKDGTYYWVHTSIIPFRDENSKIYRYLAIRQDITQRKAIEEMLASQYVKKLEQKNKELEQFAYIASHDLQEPLRTITTFGELLHKKYHNQLGTDANKYLNFITESTGRMRDLVKALLDYARIGGDKEMEEVDCLSIIKSIQQDMIPYIGETNTTLIINELPKIIAFKTEIRLLFQNLISNAIKFRKQDVSPVIHISSRKVGHYWEFAIEDNGIGIDEKFNQRIFEIFQRLHKRSQYEGTGIGLTHCHKIVELHGGSIWIKSKVGEGSTFFFTLPIFNEKVLHSPLAPDNIKSSFKET
ncbi:sensor histidine kinase [Chondrinema litorale]|uniref:sensor histidine kinase n=1 Tax=Chondrinema litorale TaxID=2994555 RepID=UPI0025436CD3|nr:PAS domain-containing sensor histidine kinase [Chondrinema litorale]UZR98157.1 ATP-binding protein [Chondrinema litorale]